MLKHSIISAIHIYRHSSPSSENRSFDKFGETTCGSGSYIAPVSIVDFRGDFLPQLHKFVVGKRAGHNLRAVLDQTVGHLLNVPEQRGLVVLVCRRTID